MASIDNGPVIPPSFPQFDPIRVRIPIISGEMTIWPAPKETFWEWVEGFPFELHPFAWDYMWVSCDRYRLEIKPHYLKSTWDTFWTDGTGYVTAQALGGLFPFTLGKEVDLLRGIVCTIEVLPDHIRDRAPKTAEKIEQIHAILKTREPPSVTEGRPPLAGWRRTVSEAVWRRKLRRLLRAANGGASSR